MRSILQAAVTISLIAVAIPVPLAAQPNNARPGAVLACPPGQVAVRGACVRGIGPAEAHRADPPPVRSLLGQRLRTHDYRVVQNPSQHDLPPLPRGQRYVIAGGQLVVLEESRSEVLRILPSHLAPRLHR